VDRWIDGDSVVLTVDKGFRTAQRREKFRLVGIDTPEIRGVEKEQGLVSKARVEELAPAGSGVVILSHKNKNDKYGRWLIEIWGTDEDEPRSINKVLIDEGLATEYGK
jgi:micrococcal nuclease